MTRSNDMDARPTPSLSWVETRLGEAIRDKISLPLSSAWTDAEEIFLWPGGVPDRTCFRPRPEIKGWPRTWLRNTAEPSMRVFRPLRPNGRALLVIPGGAYLFVSVNDEGIRIAEPFNRLGYTVFVLNYRLPAEGWPHRASVPLQDAQRAIRLIRSMAGSFEIEDGSVAAIGFSAGGHLAASLATGFAVPAYAAVDATDAIDARPHAAGLIYPVITMNPPFAQADTRSQLLGETPGKKLAARHSVEMRAGRDTPPLFLLHACDDPVVKVENSQLMFEAMRAASRPVEMHLLQEGGHGFGPGLHGSPSEFWPQYFDLWLRKSL